MQQSRSMKNLCSCKHKHIGCIDMNGDDTAKKVIPTKHGKQNEMSNMVQNVQNTKLTIEYI